MARTAKHSILRQGIFRRALAEVWAVMQAFEHTSFDHTLDRIERLERHVGRLQKELRESPNAGAVAGPNASAAKPE